MPKIFNVDFSATTKINSIAKANIENIEYVTYNDDNTGIVVGGGFKGFDKYSGGIARILTGGTIDNTFVVDYGFICRDESCSYNTDIVSAIVIDSNNTYYVGGSFTTYKDISANRIIRLNTDGSIDNTFSVGVGFNATVLTIERQSDGKIIVGGSFTTYKNISATRIIRLNTDGSIDNTFSVGVGFNGTVNSIKIQSDGRIIVGGSFTTYQGVSATRIIRLNTDGSIDNTFVYGSGFNNSVIKIKLDSLGRILVVGTFTTYQGVSATRIIRLNTDGSIDNTFVYGSGFNGDILEITIDTLDKIYVGGRFSTYNGVTNNRLIKLNTDGSRDSSFIPSFSTNGSTWVNSIAIDINNKIVVGGAFTMYNSNNTVVNNLIRLNANASLDNSFDYNGSYGTFQAITLINFDNSNKIIIGGSFNSYKEPNSLYSLKTYNGKTNNSFNPNYGVTVASNNVASISTIFKSSTNNIYIGGNFEYYSLLNSFFRGIAILGLNTDGSPNPSFDTFNGANFPVTRIFEDKLGKLFLSGSFTTYKGVTVPRFVKVNQNASIDNTFNRSGLQTNVNYTAMDFDSLNNIYLGGSFGLFSGLTNNRIIKLRPDGFKDSSFDNSIGFNGDPTSIIVDSYGKILVVGYFTTYKGNTENRIIRLNPDGSKDNTFDNSIGFNSGVNGAKMWGDKIYVYGNFSAYKNITYNGLIRLNYDGSIDTTFNIKKGIAVNGGGNISTLNVDSKGNVYLSGYIRYQNYERTPIIKIKPDGTRDVLFNVPTYNFRRNTTSLAGGGVVRALIFL